MKPVVAFKKDTRNDEKPGAGLSWSPQLSQSRTGHEKRQQFAYLKATNALILVSLTITALI
jgi:hypothetical protein